MPDIVNQITLNDITVEKAEESLLTFAFTWELNGGSCCGYSGEYIVLLYENGLEKIRQTITASPGEREGIVSFDGISCGNIYQMALAVPEVQGGVSSGKKTLIIDGFKNVRGSYDGQSLSLEWALTSDTMAACCCNIQCSNGVNSLSYPLPRAGFLKLESLHFEKNQTLTVTLTGTDKISVYGPPSSKLVFYTSGAELISVDREAQETGSRLTARFRSPYEHHSSAALNLFCNGKLVSAVEALSVRKEDDIYVLTADVPYSSVMPAELERCEVSCTFVEGTARTEIADTASMLPLSAPVLSVKRGTQKEAELSVSMSASVPAGGFEDLDGRVFYENSFSVPRTDTPYRVRPRFGCCGFGLMKNGDAASVRTGVWSEPVSVFESGYYPDRSDHEMTGMRYRQSSYAEEVASRVYTEELFCTHLTEVIESGCICLEPSDAGYILKILTNTLLTREIFDTFIQKIKENILPKGFFLLTEAILRMAHYRMEDAAYFSCAFDPEQRSCDLRPGMLLRVDTALYMPQYAPETVQSAGFVSVNSAMYRTVFDAQAGWMEFDSFIGTMAAHMDAPASADGKTQITYASGIMDFMRPSFRQPYFRLLYPSVVCPPFQTEDPYPSDNVILMASDSYAAILSACESIRANPAMINQLNLPVMIFRGRSSVSVLLSVTVNGAEQQVPIGTTVGELLQSRGILQAKNVRMERVSAEGEYCPVFLDSSVDLYAVSLLCGDRIEV